jgi:hypothetical protein
MAFGAGADPQDQLKLSDIVFQLHERGIHSGPYGGAGVT